MRDRVEFDPDVARGVPEPLVPVAHIAGPALDVHFADPDEQVDVRVVGAVCQFQHRTAVHEQVLRQGGSGEAQHVVTLSQLGVVAIAALRRQQRPPGRRGRLLRVVAEVGRPRVDLGRGVAQVSVGLQV